MAQQVHCSYEECRGGLISVVGGDYIKDGLRYFHDEDCQRKQEVLTAWKMSQKENFFDQLFGIQEAPWQARK